MTTRAKFADQQPRHGDTIMHCGHLDGSMHWFQYEKPLSFQRPDGSCGQAEWFAACQACFVKHGEKVVRLVRGDDLWTGDAPVIVKEEN